MKTIFTVFALATVLAGLCSINGGAATNTENNDSVVANSKVENTQPMNNELNVASNITNYRSVSELDYNVDDRNQVYYCDYLG